MPVGIQAVEELARLGAADEQLAERRDVDQSGGVVDGERLALGVAVVVGAPPVARPLDPWRRARGGGRGSTSAWPARSGAPRARPAAPSTTAAARSSSRPPRAAARSLAPSAGSPSSWHIRPWQGPIVTVVNRLHSSIESYPSSTPRRMSLAVTSSQKQANALPFGTVLAAARHELGVSAARHPLAQLGDPALDSPPRRRDRAPAPPRARRARRSSSASCHAPSPRELACRPDPGRQLRRARSGRGARRSWSARRPG